MLILKSLLSGGNTTQSAENNIKGDNRGGTTSEAAAFVRKSDSLNKDKTRKMEFMYCIPDLEVFIDKTIKKCLLEYDLDANDTEAVLDDMEKAWPKSPPRSTERQGSKDSNDSSEKSKDRQISATNHPEDLSSVGAELEEGTLREGDAILPNKRVTDVDSRSVTERLLERRDERADGKRDLEHAFNEGDRSDTSSPDVGDGKSQAPKHPKLKSLLQQRYFEGQENCHHNNDQTRRTVNDHQPRKTADDQIRKTADDQHRQTADDQIRKTADDQPRKTADDQIRKTADDQHRQTADDKHDDSWDTNRLMSSNLDLLASAANIHTESARAAEQHRLQAVRRIQEESEKQFQEKVATQLQNSSRLKSVSPEICQKMSPRTPFHEDPYFTVSAKSQDKNVTSYYGREITKQLFHHSQISNHTIGLQEKVVIKRDLSTSSDEEDVKLGKRQILVSGNSSLSWDNGLVRVTSAPSPRYYSQNHHDHPPTHSDSFLEPFQYHGSRIANIIAEELQRDDDCGHDPQSRDTQPSVYRVIPEETTSSALFMRSSSSPGPYQRVISSESSLFRPQISSPHSHIDMHSKAAKNDESANTAQPKTMPHLLPAHLVMTNTHTGSAIVVSNLGHITPGCNSSISNCSVPVDEDQPQDLSTKSRRFMEDGIEHNNFSSLKSFSPAAVTDTRGYTSTISSPLPALDRVHHPESLALHKSPPPSIHSDRECQYNSECNTGNGAPEISKKLKRNGQVSSFDIYPAGARDSQVFAEKRSLQSLMEGSETGNSEFTKRRKLL